jgi:hypothetical protein
LFAHGLRLPSPLITIAGHEYAYVVNSGEILSLIFQKTGAIPLWNPFVGHGEPMLESLFSFVFNPFMFLPFLAFGGVTGGKVVVLIHLGIMAAGGWSLARVLRLGRAARILLALLLAASGSWLIQIAAGYLQIGIKIARTLANCFVGCR